MQKLQLDGRTITFYDDGPRGPQGRPGESAPPLDAPIVLLHGFPLHAEIWARVARKLSDRFRVIRPNLRGFGTLTSDVDFDIPSLAGDVHDLARALGLPRFHLAGLSMGGYVALAYASRWPEDLLGLGLVNTRSAADAPAAKAKRDDMARLADKSGTAAIAHEMHPKMLSPTTRQRQPELDEELLRIMLDTPAVTVSRAALAMRDRPDYTDDLRRFAADGNPVAFVAGGDDAIVPSDELRALAEACPGSRLDVVEGVGHMSPIEAPDTVAESLAWLADARGR